MLKAEPAVALAGALIPKCAAGCALTKIVLLVPVMEALAVSVPVMVWLPVLLSVALKLPVPLLRVLLAGNTALPSVLVKWTVPPYAVAVLPKVSLAVTVKLAAVPAVTGEGKPTTINILAAAG